MKLLKPSIFVTFIALMAAVVWNKAYLPRRSWESNDCFRYCIEDGWFGSEMSVRHVRTPVDDLVVEATETEKGTRYDPVGGSDDGTFFLVDWKGYLQHWNSHGLVRTASRREDPD
ncbi:MAG: hypothetical protein GY856_36730 [bacterium]|nr:hypothetical protein [bacterium]